MKYITWLLKAFVFFTLFAFALNNQQLVSVHFFFGQFWETPLVLVVLASFTCGIALGIFLMIPLWFKKKRTAASKETEPSEKRVVNGAT